MKSQFRIWAAVSPAIFLLVGCNSIESQQQAKPASQSTASRTKSPSESTAGGHVWHMKRVEVKANIGWDALPQWGITATPIQDIVAMDMLIPSDWTFAGGSIVDGPADCNFNSGRLGFTAMSPDKMTSIVSKPVKDSVWSTDRSLLQVIEANNKQFAKMQFCKIEQPQPLASKMDAMLTTFSNGRAKAAGPMQPIPGMSEKLGPLVREANQRLAQQGASISVEAGRVLTHAADGSTATEGYFSVLQVTRTDTLPNGATVITTNYPMQVRMSAPRGQLASLDPMFSAMLDSVHVSPVYEEAMAQFNANMARIQQLTKQKLNQIYANMAADNAYAAKQQQAIHQGVQNYANQIHSNVAANRSAALEHSSQQFAMHMGDQALYHDPSTGQNVQLSNQYGHAWASTTGNNSEVILTDSPSYNPNGQAGSGSWTEMQQVK